MKTSFRVVNILVVLIIVSCTSQPTASPTVVDVERAVSILPAEIREPAAVSPEDVITPTPVNTNTPIPVPTDVLSLIGTALPANSESITINNYAQIKRIGQWGRGSILGVGFTPDGKSFVAISEMGWSIYNMDALDQSPQWVAFDAPILFDEFYFSSDGLMIKFYRSEYNNKITQIRSFPSAALQELESGAVWLKPDVVKNYSDITLRSPDGKKSFKSNLVYGLDEAIFSEEKSVREMYNENRDLIYKLRDDAPYVTYSDRNGPEGCDLSVFSMCGNALMPVATTPVKALFSSDGGTFAALYEPPSLYSGIMKDFSYIRIYESASGDLLGSLGGFTKPVQDFSYSPDGKLLVVGYVDGSIVLWDIKNSNTIFGARHMNAPAWKVLYSQDSKFLLIQRAEELEVRLTTNGSLVSRYEAVEYAVSTAGNLMALGDDDGNIQIRDIGTGKEILNIKAHEDHIYSLAFSADGLYLASSGRDCNIKLWDLETGKLLHYFEETAVDAYEIGTSSRVFSTYLEFIPNRNMLIGFGSWGTVVNWNVNSGATNYVIQSNSMEYYNGMVTLKPHFPEFFDTDLTNDRFYINENGFNLITGESLGAYKPPVNLPKGCAPSGPKAVDKKLMFTRGYDNREGKICILEVETMNLLGEILVMPVSNTYVEWVNWLYLSPDGRQLIITVGSGIIYVYQIM